MLNKIIDYFDNLRNEYKHQFNEPIFSNYHNTKPFIKRFRKFLINLFQENPTSVEVVCVLASAQNLLCYELIAIEILEKFLNENIENLSDQDKARICTNIGFYYEYTDLGRDYLLKAEKLNSPFLETYKGLGLYYFSEYQFYKEEIYIRKSLKYFEKAIEIDCSYEIQFDYAVVLFELKEYQKAKERFEKLLLEYPNRMRLLLSLAYCETYLGNKSQAILYLEQIKAGRDCNYNLNTDDIGDYEIHDVYYVLEEYMLFLKECSKTIMEYSHTDWAHYYYALYLYDIEKFNDSIHQQISNFQNTINDRKLDDDFESEEEKQEYIQSDIEDLEKFIAMIDKIKNENYKPEIKLSLYPEFSCFLIDCIKHKF